MVKEVTVSRDKIKMLMVIDDGENKLLKRDLFNKIKITII